MTYSGTLIVVNDCTRALKFYSDMFELALIWDNGGKEVWMFYRQQEFSLTWKFLFFCLES